MCDSTQSLKRIAFVILIQFLSCSAYAEFIIWNVGQGQWATKITDRECLHFDMGGEINVIHLVLKSCQEKQNILFISHADWDHISFVTRFAAKTNRTCFAQKIETNQNSWKTKYFEKIPLCSERTLMQVQTEVQFLNKQLIQKWILESKKAKANDLSYIFKAKKELVLLTGDAPKKMEKYLQAEALTDIRILVLGHHGSKTSTSKLLLKRTLNLKMAVASARNAKYGHPHRQVQMNLKKKKVPLIKTEDWGHLHFTDGKACIPFQDREPRARNKRNRCKH